MARPRDYRAEYAARLAREYRRAEELGIEPSRARARGHARAGELPARRANEALRVRERVEEYEDQTEPHERDQAEIYEEIEGLRGDYVGVKRADIPQWLWSTLVDDLGYSDEDAWAFLYGGSP